MTTTSTTDQHGVGPSATSATGVTDPPDPEHHEPPRHPDSSDEVSALDDGDIDPDGIMPTESADGKPVGVAEGQDDDIDPWKEPFLVDDEADKRRRQEENYTTALAIVEGRYPNADPDDRVAWARAVARLPQSVEADGRRIFLTISEFDALEAKLDATNVRSASADPDESIDLEELAREADALPEDPDESEPVRSEWDEAEQGTARVIPEDGASFRVSESFARRVGEILGLPISESIVYPMEFRSAERILRSLFPEMSENHRCVCAYALAGYTSYPVEGQPGRVNIDLTHIEAWFADALEDRQRRAELDEMVQSAAVRAIENRLPQAVRGFTAQIEMPWYKSPEGVAAIVAIALVILFFSFFVVKEERELSRTLARRDAAAAEIGTVYNKDGEPVSVTTFEELAAATGFPEDPAARELRLMAASASHESRIRVIESKRDELNKERDDAVAMATLETDRRTRSEAAFDDLEELRREEQDDYALRQRELEGKLSRAERLLGVATSDVEAARILYKDHVRAGRCGNPLDEEYPSDAGGLRAHYQCDFGRVVCAGRLPSEADNCRRVER